ATGALASSGVERAKHSGVVSAFGEHFIRSGKLGGEFGRMLRQTMEDRETSDYDEIPVVDHDLTQERLNEARRFISAVTTYLAEQGISLE
ncbi:MAG: MAC/perforin domain-containing protein, partial [Chloroflexota bacterium]